ncbi:hypothetical protein K435DRAFT_681266 [Dendrothele bispora CBS 962.96]|uniref:Fungal pheromone STE3G-protein-coupled receptor n=1 Tax=Dendrothele bispora (strain CBS 962.96) TaxID=1314807 RepID=A0A4S8LFC7_DENBC|nr:hypothetical protein K435DRAFT_681266 [Dendrothele bispora CBS 962.96]
MLFLLLLTHLFSLDPAYAALANDSFASISFDSSSRIDPCANTGNQRTIEEIVYSSIAVIFTCTWVAIHPNIPMTFDSEGEKVIETSFGMHPAVFVLQDFLLTLVALIAPELIIFWAMRQWFASREIQTRYKGFRWTNVHGFFYLMGGFILTWDGKEYGYRTYIHEGETRGRARLLLDHLLNNKIITITEEEIMDRSKRDALAKFIAISQTVWFIVQCIIRGAEGLAITNLEILTLSFAMLNFVTYFFWRNKPQRVCYPIKISQLLVSSAAQNNRDNEDSGGASFDSKKSYLSTVCHEIKSDFKEKVFNDTEGPTGVKNTAIKAVIALFYPVSALLHQVSLLIEGHSYYRTGLKKDPRTLYVVVFSLASVFGLIHCLPWYFHFPTDQEQMLWRVCALLVTVLPITFIPMIDVIRKVIQSLPYPLRWFFAMFVLVSPMYIAARIILLVLALIEFRALSPSAYQAVQWSTFIPHLN